MRRRSTASTAIIWSPPCVPAGTARLFRCRKNQPQLAGLVKGLAQPGDYVVCLGAGSITQWAYSLAGELKAQG